MRETERSFILSSIVMGKISKPTLESLVKTETSSNDFLSGFIAVYQNTGEVTLHGVLGWKLRLTFRITDRALDAS